MKRFLILAAVALAGMAARATLYTRSFSGGTIADGNPVGQIFTGNFTAAPSGCAMSSLTVSLNLSSSYNGDLYAYLVAPNGTLVVLMNQPGISVNGFGASGAGMNITLSDAVFSGTQVGHAGAVMAATTLIKEFHGTSL